jgi:FAD/FMN-containing dehydrogenase
MDRVSHEPKGPDTMTPKTLAGRIAGEVLLPTDDAYEQRRNVMFRTGRPAAIVRCQTSDDIRYGLEYARDAQLDVSVRSGGHSGPGFGTNDGGVVLDLSPMNTVEIVDPARRIIRIGSGATWIEVARPLAPHGLAISSGDTTSVGVGGLLLGGGIGWMVRKYGLTIDSLVAAEIVTADGRLRRASSDDHADLFWAIRGGGGNVGVVTSFDVVAQPVREVRFGTIAYPDADAATIVKRWRDAMRAAPDDLTTTVQLLPAGPGRLTAVVGVCLPEDGATVSPARVVEPLTRLVAEPRVEVSTRPYAEVFEESQELPPGLSPIAANVLTPDCSDELIDLVTSGLGGLGMTVGQFRSLGGAVARVPSEATAFAHRDSEALVIMALLKGTPETRARFDALRRTLRPLVSGSYSNLMNTTEPEDVASIYPPQTYERLTAVKRAYDPDNVFRHNYNVPPSRADALR